MNTELTEYKQLFAEKINHSFEHLGTKISQLIVKNGETKKITCLPVKDLERIQTLCGVEDRKY